MRKVLAGAFGALAMAVAFAPHPARADPVAAVTPDSEARRLGVDLARRLLQSLNFRAILERDSGDLGTMFASIKGRPDWPDLIKQSFLEEIEQDQPKFDRVVGYKFADYFSLEELRAGAAFMDGPGGAAIAQTIADKSAGRPSAPPSPEVKRAMERVAAMPGGRTFFEKFGNIGSVLDGTQSEYMAILLPGVFRRFGEKAQAAEAARDAAAGH